MFHFAADVVIVAALGVIAVYAGLKVNDRPGFGPDIQLINTSSFLSYIGTAVYAYEGVGLIIPVMETYKYENKYPMVILSCLVALIFLYNLIGLFNYLAYGSELSNAPVRYSKIMKLVDY
jgi:proton-coupled amino acid transporter